MAYLRWSPSPWYAYAHADGGDGDEAVLVAWHESGPGLQATAKTLRRAGCESRIDRLRNFMAGLPELTPEALRDTNRLAPAVDQFLFETYNAGKIPMPVEVARRCRVLNRLVQRAFSRPQNAQAEDAREIPLWVRWARELKELSKQYPPPPLPQPIRDLVQARALRALAGVTVDPGKDAAELAQIESARLAWPPVRWWHSVGAAPPALART